MATPVRGTIPVSPVHAWAATRLTARRSTNVISRAPAIPPPASAARPSRTMGRLATMATPAPKAMPVRRVFVWARIRWPVRRWTSAMRWGSAIRQPASAAPPTRRKERYVMTVTRVPKRTHANPGGALDQTRSPVRHPTNAMTWERAIPRPGNVRIRPSRMERLAATAMRVLGRTPANQDSALQAMPSRARHPMRAMGSAPVIPRPEIAATRPRKMAARAMTATSAHRLTPAKLARAWVRTWLPTALRADPLAAATRVWAASVHNMHSLMRGPHDRCTSCSWPSKSALLLARNFQNERRALALSRRELFLLGSRATEQDQDLLGPGRWDQ